MYMRDYIAQLDAVKCDRPLAEVLGMKELLTYIVQNLVEKSDEVTVAEREQGGETVFEVRVAPGDMGKVIGRQGRVVKEIRVLMKAVAQRQGRKVSVEVLD